MTQSGDELSIAQTNEVVRCLADCGRVCGQENWRQTRLRMAWDIPKPALRLKGALADDSRGNGGFLVAL